MLLDGCGGGTERPAYVTWDSREPDVWASIWLLDKSFSGDVDILVRDVGAPTDDAIAFAVPGATLRRSAAGSAYESLLAHLEQTDPVLTRVGEIVRALEVTRWSGVDVWEAQIVEQYFRALQMRFQGNVPSGCYREFFDRLHGVLADGALQEAPGQLENALADPSLCAAELAGLGRNDTMTTVRQIPIDKVLEQIAAGQRVIFVDAREEGEFAESHIPGAVNMTLRQVTDGSVGQFADADLVIGYCIKDFRGFEVAQALARHGIRQVGTMNPHGLAGWIAAKLPVAGKDGLPNTLALAALNACADDPSSCR